MDKKENIVGFNHFVGKEFFLHGVDTTTISKESYSSRYEDCSVMNFALDGVVYSAIEDPNDGYRSSLDEIYMVDDVEIKNTFPPCKVRCEWADSDRYDKSTGEKSDDLIEFIDTSTHKTVLRVGTSHSDDYYPSFVANFIPENMVANAPTVALESEFQAKMENIRTLIREREREDADVVAEELLKLDRLNWGKF